MNSPRLKIVYDFYHVQVVDGDVVRTLRDNLDWICHIHVAGIQSRPEIDDTHELNYRFIALRNRRHGLRRFRLARMAAGAGARRDQEPGAVLQDDPDA